MTDGTRGAGGKRATPSVRPPVGPPEPRPRLALTTRAAVLALAVIAVLLTLAYPLKQYLAQRDQIQAAAAAQRADDATVTALQRAHALSTTAPQIEAQARARLHYTFPGERNYIRVLPAPTPTPTSTRQGQATVPLIPGSTWYDRLLRSDTDAGNAHG